MVGCSWFALQTLLTCIVDVMRSILPEELQGEIPSGFNTAGHVGMLTSHTGSSGTELTGQLISTFVINIYHTSTSLPKSS